MDVKSGDVFEVPAGQKPLSEATAAKVGFRELNTTESDLVRDCRNAGEMMRDLVQKLEDYPDADPRWRSIARTHFQEGLMCAVRSITKPAFF